MEVWLWTLAVGAVVAALWLVMILHDGKKRREWEEGLRAGEEEDD